MNALLTRPNSPNAAILIPPNAETDGKSRLRLFAEWLDLTGRTWDTPDLAAYRDYLMGERPYIHPKTGKPYTGRPLSPSSVKVHLSTIRARYAALLRDNHIRDLLYSSAPADASASDKKAFVDEALTRLENATHPDTAPVENVTRQDTPDGEHIRLTPGQANTLLNAPRRSDQPFLLKLRDTAIIALMLCTGIREAELCNLDVSDLRQRLGGELALHVRRGKGAKERLIPYGDLSFCLAYVDAWLKHAGITDGAVFRGFFRGYTRVRSERLTPRAVQDVLKAYPVMVDGQRTAVAPHDLRRTYARRLYEAGVDLVAIQQNLGHADVKTTLGYIGTLDASRRKPPAIYEADLSWID